MALRFVICAVMFFLLSTTQTRSETRVNVTTTLGQIIGFEETITFPDDTQHTLRVFRGIPYALPPVGQLRFSKPRPALPFSQPLEAVQFGPACPQRQTVASMSEDCLYLNIFTPLLDPENSSLPVIVWIHGGAFISSEGRQLPAETLVSFGNIIAVTFNFRLGALGFLTTDDQEASGNWGLWDQRLALQWVKENIVHFNGDPDRITLAGTTSGAFCVTHHALYPANTGLFRRIIVESGTAISAASFQRKGLKYAAALASKLGCNISDSAPNLSRRIIACLREKDPESITSAAVRADQSFLLTWTPVLDEDFIDKDPWTVLSWPPSGLTTASLGSVDALIGTTSSDGNILFNIWVPAMASAMNESVASGVSLRVFEKVVEAVLNSPWGGEDDTDNTDHMDHTANKDNAWMVNQAVVQEYRDWEQSGNRSQARGRSLVDVLTDKGFFTPSIIFTRNHHATVKNINSSSSTYMYEFDQRSPVPSPFSWMSGSLHKDQDLYVLGFPQTLLSGISVDHGTEEGATEWRFSQSVMTYWSNFVKTGNPNTPDAVSVEWPPFTLANEDYLHLKSEETTARRHCRGRKTVFWLDYLPKLRSYIRKQERNCRQRMDTPSHAESLVHSTNTCSVTCSVLLAALFLMLFTRIF